MGLILDSNVLIQAERNPNANHFGRFADYGNGYISAITVSELLVGVPKTKRRTESTNLDAEGR
jgi:tRNA(fMet)-specific endonuclease VapC